MNYCKLTLLLLLATSFNATAQTFTLDNGIVRREILFADNHLTCKTFCLTADNKQFIRKDSPEFSFLMNDKPYSGMSRWSTVQQRDTADATGGKGFILTLKNAQCAVDIAYLVYPKLPVVYKTLTITNTGTEDVKIESLDVENLTLTCHPVYSWVYRQFARYKYLGPYVGDWNDPLIAVHDINGYRGVMVGNEALGVTKRTAAFEDGKSLTAGLRHSNEEFAFRKWLRTGEQYTAPRVFTALYNDSPDPVATLNTVIPDFVRRHADMRIDKLPQKPMFFYNTWSPFLRNVNDGMIRELARAASECGVEVFIIDDGWQASDVNEIDGALKKSAETTGDWEVDRRKFPDGLRPVFDYIKSLGMKPGLWLSLATADFAKMPNSAHPEWFTKDVNGQLANLHTEQGTSKTACLATDWYDYIKGVLLRLVREHGLSYVKLDLAIVTSAYVFDRARTGCYATDHALHRDREESYEVIYRRCMQLFDDLHREAPELFIDCSFETAGKMQLMDYGIARHADGNWLANIDQTTPTGPLRVRNLVWGRSPALPAASLVLGNLQMDGEYHRIGYMSQAGSMPLMLGDPRKLAPEERQWYKTHATWLRELERRHGIMSFRQDLPGFGEPADGCWDGFCRINTETLSGGLVAVFRHGAKETTRTVTVPYLNPATTYTVRTPDKEIAQMTGKDLSEKGFPVSLPAPCDAALFEINPK